MTIRKKDSLTLPRIGFGTGGIGNLNRRLSEGDAALVLEHAFDAGFRFFDTAPLYGYGLSELRLGRLLRETSRANFLISTKVGRYLEPAWGRPVPTGRWSAPLPLFPVLDYSRAAVMRSLEQSFARLGLDSVDLVFIHDIDRRNLGDAYERCYSQAVDEAYRVLHDLRSAGHIKAIGVGVNEAEPALNFIRDTDIDVVMLAGRLTILDHADGMEFLIEARSRGVFVIAAAVFNSGILGDPSSGAATYDYEIAPAEMRSRTEAIREISAAANLPLQAIALQFPLQVLEVDSIVVGMSRLAHIDEVLAWSKTPIQAAIWDELERNGFIDVRVRNLSRSLDAGKALSHE